MPQAVYASDGSNFFLLWRRANLSQGGSSASYWHRSGC